MALTLRVTSFQNQALGADSTRVFGAQGGAIGRALDNDWVLPDPDKFVSSHHAQILCRGGNYFLQDRSTNGTYINGSPQPVGKNSEQQLFDGDRIQIAEYEIAVELEGSAQQSVTGPTGPSVPGWQQQTGSGLAGTGTFSGTLPQKSDNDILNVFDNGSAPPPVPGAPGWTPPAPDHASVMDQNFVPPTPQPMPSQDNGMIPENWDETSFTPPDSVPPGPSGTYNQPQMAQAPPQAQAAPAVSATDQQSIVGMLMAAGLDQANAQAAATPENLNAIGQILGLTTQGLIDVLTARSAVKSQFRVPMTMMRPVENNALKSSANASEALVNLLVMHNPAYLNAVEAFAEGFEDIKAHQVALMAGMRAAFDSMLQRFDPDELEERFKKRKSKSMLRMPGNMQNWEMYKSLYDEMTQDADANFQRLFGEEFARAYEEQMQRLTSGRRRM
jgi:type VI secretion system protein